MWRNHFYCGIHKNKFLEGDIIEGNWSALISKDSFKLINDRFDAKPEMSINLTLHKWIDLLKIDFTVVDAVLK